jgi:hypothetical protein
MNVPLVISAAALAGASLFDGWTTVRVLKNHDYVEKDTAWLFGPRPSTLKVYGLGTAVIAGEIISALLLNELTVYVGYAMAAAGGYQVYTHVRDGLANLKIPVK